MPLNIVFMGTPEFAVPCLCELIQAGHSIKAVFSQPDRPKGRGYKLTPPPVKVAAQEHGIPVYQPNNMKDGTGLEILKEINPDLIVVVAYGHILPKEVLDLPKYGCINVHASLLPKLRGAAPIQWSIINGDQKTCVTIMHMDEGMDTGDIILMEETEIIDGETSPELFVRLSKLGSKLLIKAVTQIENGTATRTPQNHAEATYAPMLSKKMSEIEFDGASCDICCLVRGLSSFCSPYVMINGKRVKILKAKPADNHKGKPGTLLDNKELIIGCQQGAIHLLEVQPEGKKPQTGEQFINGNRLKKGDTIV